jgi:DNA-binding transcriptional regulator YiaG
MKPSPSNKRRIEHRKHEVTIPTADGSAVAERIPIRVPMEWDPEIGEWLLTPEAEALIETTKARHMGLLLPHDLLGLRLRLGLSQQAIGELLQIGAKSWTRWETGHQRPSRSINLLLRALHSGFISPMQLREMGMTRHDWSAQFRVLASSGNQVAEPFSLDVCRQMQSAASVSGGCVESMELPA